MRSAGRCRVSAMKVKGGHQKSAESRGSANPHKLHDGSGFDIRSVGPLSPAGTYTLRGDTTKPPSRGQVKDLLVTYIAYPESIQHAARISSTVSGQAWQWPPFAHLALAWSDDERRFGQGAFNSLNAPVAF